MRLHRFHVGGPITENFEVTDRDLVHQWSHVFRYNVGSQVILFDDSGVDYLAIITSLRNLGATLSILEKKNNRLKQKRDLTLCLAITKKGNIDLVIEKATELGVKNFIPFICDRSEKKNVKIERLQKIAIEASEQSGRGDIPVIRPVIDLANLLNSDNLLPDRVLFLDRNGKPVTEVFKEDIDKLAIFIGPEGGWSEGEIKEFSKHNIQSVSLGSQILRSETAAVAISSLLLL